MSANVKEQDALLVLLIDFFDLSPETKPDAIRQESIATWDSLAMVQLITELQGAFSVDFDLDEIEHLRSYAEIRAALSRKGVRLGEAS